MSAVHLKPCPYCGCAARYVAADYVDNSGEPWPFAECDACNTGAPVEFWNKRAQPADQQGEPVMRLEAEKLWGGDGEYTVDFVKPGWLKECREKGGTFLLYASAQPATAKVVLPGRETLRDVMAAVIGGDAYDCTRVWCAWGVGTMSDDDFVPIVEQEERLYELVDACLDEVAKLNTPQ